MAENIHSDPTRDEKSYRNRSTSEIEEDIRHTRQDMDETLDALEQKFSPGELLDKMIHYFGDTPKEYADNLGRALKENPVPATLTGISLAWLMVSTSSRTGGSIYTGADAGTSKTDKARERYYQAKGKFGEKTESVKRFVSEKVGSAKETGDSLGEKGSSAYQTSRHQASRAKEGFFSLWNEQPVLLAAAGLALGAAFGMGLPRTRKEDELMGDTRDRLKRQAEQTAREQAEKGKQVAKSAGEAAKNEASGEADRQDMTASTETKKAGDRQAGTTGDGGSSTSITETTTERPFFPENEKEEDRL